LYHSRARAHPSSTLPRPLRLQNNLHELWALLNFLLPDVFGSSAAFDAWFDAAASSSDVEAQTALVRQLHRVLKPFMLRRLKVDVAKTLPPKTETLLYVGMTPKQRALYKAILLRDVGAVLKGTERGALNNVLMHLRKVRVRGGGGSVGGGGGG
jgi:SWI/SNF-related matrix-associated actin-dependent regulator of chromatin subfamily A member 5